MTKRIIYIIFAAALALYAGAVSAQPLTLAQISGYLNQLETAQGGFTQFNQDGTLSTGQIYIKRPGRIRFEYNPPEESMVIAGG
ncbi:MAG: outer membrane lipoprotein-sorting protein, partial [Yoonia sp.]